MSLLQLRNKIFQLEKDFQETYEKVQLLMNDVPTVNGEIYCYFTQAIILDHETNTSHLIIGSFYVKNITKESKHSPMILLKISSETDFNFSGKFKSHQRIDQNYNFTWERMMLDHLDPHTHFCFQPINLSKLSPKQQLAFENFQIKIPLNASITIEGFVYFNHSNEGIPALNSINVSI